MNATVVRSRAGTKRKPPRGDIPQMASPRQERFGKLRQPSQPAISPSLPAQGDLKSEPYSWAEGSVSWVLGFFFVNPRAEKVINRAERPQVT